MKNKYEIKSILKNGNKFLLDMNGESFFSHSNALKTPKENYIILGPESGFSEKDIDYFLNLDFKKIKLSKYTLRTEYALAYSLGQIEMIKSSDF